MGFVAGAVNKVTDSVTGDFSVEVKNQNAQALINDFIDNLIFRQSFEHGSEKVY